MRRCDFKYFIFFAECTQLEDPRLEWRQKQETMLREYLQMAQEVLEVRVLREIFTIATLAVAARCFRYGQRNENDVRLFRY